MCSVDPSTLTDLFAFFNASKTAGCLDLTVAQAEAEAKYLQSKSFKYVLQAGEERTMEESL